MKIEHWTQLCAELRTAQQQAPAASQALGTDLSSNERQAFTQGWRMGIAAAKALLEHNLQRKCVGYQKRNRL